MTAVIVTTAATTIVAASQATRFIAIHNNSAQTVYVSYDGTTVDTASGMPILTGTALFLTGEDQCKKGLFGIVAATTADVRVQVG